MTQPMFAVNIEFPLCWDIIVRLRAWKAGAPQSKTIHKLTADQYARRAELQKRQEAKRRTEILASRQAEQNWLDGGLLMQERVAAASASRASAGYGKSEAAKCK